MSRPIAVLIVDDDSDSRTLLELALSGEGHTVLSATNGAEALVVARRAHPDVILLDLAMPIMDGFGFRAAQLDEPALAAIPVICVSGRHDSMEAARSLKLDACVTKPFAFEEIVACVKELARRRAPRRSISSILDPDSLAAL